MRFKSTAVLFVVFVAIAGYIYFAEFHNTEEREKQEASKSNAIQVDAKDITEISLAYAGQTITGVKTGEKQWEITAPERIAADSDAWQQLTEGLVGVKRDETVTEDAQDLSPYGLKEPAVQVTAQLKDGKRVGLMIGGDNPKKNGKYAKLIDSNAVFLTAPPWELTFKKTLNDMRDKKIVHFEPDDIDGLTIVAGTTELALEKITDGWRIRKPVDTAAENDEVNAFLTTMRLANASFPESAVDSKTTGLDSPSIRISLRDVKAKTDRVVIVGKAAAADRFYARDLSRDSVFIIEKQIPEKARQPLLVWRDKAITRTDSEKIDKIEIARGAERIVLSKMGPDWKLADGAKAQEAKVISILGVLLKDKVKDIIDAPKPLQTYRLDQPRLEVIYREGSNEVANLAFGADSKNPDGVYAKNAKTSAVMILSMDAYKNINVTADALRDTVPKPAQ